MGLNSEKLNYWSNFDAKEPEFSLGAQSRKFEQELIEYYYTSQRAERIKSASDSQLRLMCGEMTAQEIRTVRAVVNYICENK